MDAMKCEKRVKLFGKKGGGDEGEMKEVKKDIRNCSYRKNIHKLKI
jgi:hypothetical protein